MEPLKHQPLLLFLLLFLYACATPANQKEDPGATRKKAKPNPYDEGRSLAATAARTTGTTLLTDIKEIGLLNTAGRVTCLVIDESSPNHLIAGVATGGI